MFKFTNFTDKQINEFDFHFLYIFVIRMYLSEIHYIGGFINYDLGAYMAN